MLKASTGSSRSTALVRARPAGLLKPAALHVLMTFSLESTQNYALRQRPEKSPLLCHWERPWRKLETGVHGFPYHWTSHHCPPPPRLHIFPTSASGDFPV